MQQEQVEEWAENPVTRELHKRVKALIEEFGSIPVHGLLRNSASETHENLIYLSAQVETWDDIIDVLDGDWSSVGEVDEE